MAYITYIYIYIIYIYREREIHANGIIMKSAWNTYEYVLKRHGILGVCPVRAHVEYMWNMYGIPMKYIWNAYGISSEYTEHVWSKCKWKMCGMRPDKWKLHGHRMEHVWNMYRIRYEM